LHTTFGTASDPVTKLRTISFLITKLSSDSDDYSLIINFNHNIMIVINN
jgi:hypothetical protein